MLPTPTLYIHLQRIAILYKNFAICTRPCTYSNALFTINVVSIFVRLEKISNEFYCIVLQKFILNAIYIFSCQDTISLSTYHHNFCLLHSMFLPLVRCRILLFFSNFIINIPLITTLNFMFMKSSLFLDTHAYFNYKIISSHFQYKWRIFG